MQDISEEILGRAKQGDIKAFEMIVRACGDFVFNVSLRFLRHHEDAQEVSQEVFLTLHRKLASFESRSNLKTWLYRITINTAINYTKRFGKMKDKTVEYDETINPHPQDGFYKGLSESEYAKNVVNSLLGMLSDEQRACIVLRNIEGMSYEEIAKTLGININVVRSRLKRARDKMLSVKDEVMRHEL